MKCKTSFSFLLLFFVSYLFAQNITTNLPIVVIEPSSSIPSEPKIMGTMGIVYNGGNKLNQLSDEYNEYDGSIGIELRGQSSLSLFPKKSYGIETRTEDGANLNVKLLDMPKENDWVLHGPYSDKSLMRNALTYIIAGNIMPYAPRVRMVELTLYGRYQGIYVLTEKIKRDKNRVDLQKLSADSMDITGGYIMKLDKGDESEIAWVSPYKPIAGADTEIRFLEVYPKPEDITPAQKNYIKNFITDFETSLKANNYDDPAVGYRKYIDTQSFIDFLIVNEISKNVDGYRLSTYMYKDSDANGGKLKHGPVWDFNLSFGNANYCRGDSPIGWGYDFNQHCSDDYWVVPFWWKRLREDPTFNKELKNRWQTLRASTLSNEAILGTIDSLENLLVSNGAVERNFQKWDVLEEWVWPNAFIGNTYSNEVEFLRNWTSDRLEWLDVQFASISTNTEEVTVALTALSVYPNPTNGTVNFEIALPSAKSILLKIYNALGQQISAEVFEETNLIDYQWNQKVPAGIYRYSIDDYESKPIGGSFVVE